LVSRKSLSILRLRKESGVVVILSISRINGHKKTLIIIIIIIIIIIRAFVRRTMSASELNLRR